MNSLAKHFITLRGTRAGGRRKLSRSLPVSRAVSGENGQNDGGLCGCRA